MSRAHGTEAAFRANGSCTCEECREAHARYQAIYGAPAGRNATGGNVRPLVQERPGWYDHAACTDPAFPPDMFFPEDGPGVDEAIAVCAGCPSILPCREWGITHEDAGIWGGTSERWRRAERRRRKIRLTQPWATDQQETAS